MAAIELRQVEKRFDDVQALLPLDLEIGDGEFLVLLGPSGCGKTTLLRMIAGLEDVTAGDILIDGRSVTDERARERNVAMVFQNYALYPHLNVAQNLAFPLEARRLPKSEIDNKVTAVAQKLGLSDLMDRRPSQLSGGQRQRVAVGRAMVRDPKVFLFDEPLSNLDASLREGMRSELIRLHASLRNTVIYVTHDQVEAMTMAERVVVLRAGEVQQIGTPMQIYTRPRNVFVAQFIGSPSMNIVPGSLHGVKGSYKLQVGNCKLALPLADKNNADCAVLVGFRPADAGFGAGRSTRSGRLRIPVTVTAIQPLGHDVIVDLSTDEDERGVIAQLPWRSFSGKVADRLVLEIPADALHVFESSTELRMAAREDPTP